MEVIIYTTPTCTHCKSAKKYFEDHDISYEEVDISRNMAQAQRLVELTGQSGVPVIEVDGEMVIGFDKKRLAALLDLD